MKHGEVTVTIIKSDKGKLFIQFEDGFTAPIPDIMENNAIIAALDVEVERYYLPTI